MNWCGAEIYLFSGFCRLLYGRQFEIFLLKGKLGGSMALVLGTNGSHRGRKSAGELALHLSNLAIFILASHLDNMESKWHSTLNKVVV